MAMPRQYRSWSLNGFTQFRALNTLVILKVCVEDLFEIFMKNLRGTDCTAQEQNVAILMVRLILGKVQRLSKRKFNGMIADFKQVFQKQKFIPRFRKPLFITKGNSSLIHLATGYPHLCSHVNRACQAKALEDTSIFPNVWKQNKATLIMLDCGLVEDQCASLL